MRRILFIVLAVVVILGLAGWGVLQSQTFWRWGGWEVVNMAQDRLNGELQVGAVQGQPLTGFTFTDVTLTGPQGEILHTDKLELRFSLWSFIRLQPVIAKLALHEPRLTLRQDQEGRWEVANLLKKRPPPPFKSLNFHQILIQHGQAVVICPDATQRYDDLDLSLDLTVLHPKRPQQEILVHRASLGATTPLGRFGLKASLAYAQGQLKIDSLDIDSREHILAKLTGEGGLGPRQQALFSVNVGPIPGAVLHSLWPKWPRDWEVQGKFRLTVLGLTRYEISGAGQVQQASFDLHGFIGREAGPWTYDLEAKLAGLRAQQLLEPFNPQWVQKFKDLSPVAARLGLKGTGLSWPPEQLDWTLDTTAFRQREVSVEQLKVTLSGNAREQNLQGLARGNFGELSLAAAGPLLSSWKGSLKLHTENFQPARLGLEKAGETVLNGKFTGTFSWAAALALADLKLSGDLEARGRLGQEPLEDLRARLTWQQPKLEIPKASLRLGPLAAEFSGSIAGDRLNWQFKGSLAPEAARPYLPVTARGRMELSGALTGTFQAPRFSLQGSGPGLTLNGLSLKSFTFKANGAGWPPAAGDLELRGTGLSTPAGVFSQANLSCRGEANLWQLHFTAGAPESRAEVSGTADLRARPISLVLQKFSWRSPEYNIANIGPVQLRLIPGLQAATGAFKVNGGELAVKVEAQGARLAGLLNIRNFPANLLSLEGPPLKGKINGQVAIGGEPGAPLIQGKVNWGPGQVGEFPFQSMKATFDYREGFLRLTGSLDEKAPGPRLVWDGQIPVRLSLIPLRWSLGDQNLDLTVKGEKTNLAMLTAISREVQAAEGSLDIMAQFRGNPHRPQVSGQVRWGEGSIKLRVAGLPYRLLPGEARLQGGKITIPDLILESGGTLRLSGDLTLKGFTPGQLELRGQALNFLALRREGSQVEANGNLALTGPWNGARLTGQIMIPKATFATSFFQAGPHPDIILLNKPATPEPGAKVAASNLVFWNNLQVDLTLQSAGEVWVRNKDIKVDLQGSLKVIKAPGQDRMAVAGVLRAVKGTIDLQGRVFKVAEGTVTLPGKPGVPGMLAGRAISEMDEITLFLDISGPTSTPVVRLSSNPPLPPPDLLSYLVFGRPAANLSRSEYTSVGQQALGILGGISAKKLQEILGKDFPLMGGVTMRGGRETVGVTKPLTKELSVSFERKNNPLYREDTNQVRVEYKVNKYMSLESTMGRRNTGGDVLFNYDF